MKKPLILAVMCHKGGTGKTTTTLGLADAFSNTGRKVLIVDADEQSNIKTIFGIKLQQAEGGLAATLLDNIKPETLAINARPNIDVILSGGRLMREFEKTHSNTPESELLMKKRMIGSVANLRFSAGAPAMANVWDAITALGTQTSIALSPIEQKF